MLTLAYQAVCCQVGSSLRLRCLTHTGGHALEYADGEGLSSCSLRSPGSRDSPKTYPYWTGSEGRWHGAHKDMLNMHLISGSESMY